METRNSPFHSSEDRLSNLPEPLIHHILTFLNMKAVIKTSLLSKRWRYIWTSLPVLNFIYSTFHATEARKTDGFIDFVERVLMFRGSSNIQKFHLIWLDILADDCDITHVIDTWILAAVRRNVQDLSFKVFVSIHQTFMYPPCLFNCNSLTELELDMGSKFHSVVILPKSMCLPRLKSLKLESITINDDKSVTKLFSSCPVLESLLVKNCCMDLSISSFTLKEFGLEHGYYDLNISGARTFKLYAPSLTSFSCKSYMSHDYCLEGLSSLVSADIEMIVEEKGEKAETYSTLSAGVKELYAQNMLKLLKALHNVNDLSLSQWFIEVVSRVPDLLDSQPPQFANLRCLKLQTFLSRDCFHAIEYLLKISPHIESLSLTVTKNCFVESPLYPSCGEMKLNATNIGDYWETGLSLSCKLYFLQFVEIRSVLGYVNELKFLEIMLKNAMVLEKVVISFAEEEGQGDMEIRLVRFAEMLLAFPKASSSTVISFSK